MKVAEAELTKLRAKTKHDARTIEDLTKDRTSLIRRLKDRDEELRGKTKLLDVRRGPIPCYLRESSEANLRKRMYTTKLSH